MSRLSLLDDLRDEIIGNYEKRHSKPAIGAMCESDLDLLKRWHWDRYVLLTLNLFLNSIYLVNRFNFFLN